MKTHPTITRSELIANTERAKRILAVDTGGRMALSQQRAFVRWCLRLQNALTKRIPDARLVFAPPSSNHRVTLKYKDSKFTQSFYLLGENNLVAAEITVYHYGLTWAGVLISETCNDVSISHAEARVTRAANAIARKIHRIVTV